MLGVTEPPASVQTCSRGSTTCQDKALDTGAFCAAGPFNPIKVRPPAASKSLRRIMPSSVSSDKADHAAMRPRNGRGSGDADFGARMGLFMQGACGEDLHLRPQPSAERDSMTIDCRTLLGASTSAAAASTPGLREAAAQTPIRAASASHADLWHAI